MTEFLIESSDHNNPGVICGCAICAHRRFVVSGAIAELTEGQRELGASAGQTTVALEALIAEALRWLAVEVGAPGDTDVVERAIRDVVTILARNNLTPGTFMVPDPHPENAPSIVYTKGGEVVKPQ